MTMKATINSLQSGLIAIALVIRSREGPRFVFHYPPHPSTKPPKRQNRFGTELDEEPEPEVGEPRDDEDSDLEEEYQFFTDLGHMKIDDDTKGKMYMERARGSLDDEEVQDDNNCFISKEGELICPWDHLGEFWATDMESILTPSRAFHKKRFELELAPLYYITYPMHIREDGYWKKKSKKSKKSKKDSSGSGEGATKDEKGKVQEIAEGSDDEDHGGMTMFNTVFVLNVPDDEYEQRITEMYEHVIKNFNKALKTAQASCDYVWKESEMILAMKEKAREERRPMSWLWSEILIKSTMASAIRDVFVAVSKNEVAAVRLGTTSAVDLSLQIPIPMFLMSIPGQKERSMPGLLITSANPFVDEEGNPDPSNLDKNFALLLLDDEEKIINELQTENLELSHALLECIRMNKPTLSFQQVAQTEKCELNTLLMLSQHLIYWRKAIAIPPIHPREMYIVNPNCDSHQLPAASVAWRKAFPLAPSLPHFLSAISHAPRPYKTFFPSKNHRETYLDMLAWLIRNGWVTQLRTFAWITVWPEIIYEVSYQLKSECVAKKKEKAGKSSSGLQNTSSGSAESTEESGSDKAKEYDPNAPMTTEQAAERARLERLAIKAAEADAEEAAEFSKMPLPVLTHNVSVNKAAHLKGIHPYIIPDPHKVSHKESLYIAAIAKRFEDKRMKEMWWRFYGYLNGREALEMVVLKEGMKRKDAWALLVGMQEHMMVVKHW